MKKYIILSAVALLALGACSKVTPAAGDADQAITFQVANFASRTKATSLIDEGYTSFNTYAWFYDVNTGATEGQLFMNDEVVTADDTTTPTKWAPERTYYWPKTGYINFYSYAGISKDLTVTEEKLEVKDVSVNNDPNILVAKPALNQQKNTPSQDPYGQNSVTEGVPTLFTHMLAKIQFKVLLDATGMDENFTWEAKIAKDQTLLQIPATGDLSVSFADGGNVPTWTNITGNSLLTSKELTLTAKGNEKSSTEGVILNNGGADDFFVVIPQENKDLEFYMIFSLTSTYAGAAGITETVPVSFKLSKFSGANTEWIYNTKYIYTISIKPNGEVILFDPAVAEWEDGAGEIAVPTEPATVTP